MIEQIIPIIYILNILNHKCYFRSKFQACIIICKHYLRGIKIEKDFFMIIYFALIVRMLLI